MGIADTLKGNCGMSLRKQLSEEMVPLKLALGVIQGDDTLSADSLCCSDASNSFMKVSWDESVGLESPSTVILTDGQ